MTTSPPRPRATGHRARAALVAALAAALLLPLLPALPAAPAGAAQGSGPSTDLVGSDDPAGAAAVAAAAADPSFQQQGCMPAGGSAIPDPEVPDGDFVFVGGGWGHGAGMSQYGAMGAGLLGCTAEQILTTYFPGTQVATEAMPPEVIIGLAAGIAGTDVTASAGTIPWELCHHERQQECDPLPVEQQTGAVWRVDVRPDAGYRITQGGTTVWEGGSYELDLRARLSPDPSVDRRVLVGATGHTYRWGVLQIDSVARSGSSDAYVTLEIPSMELYLRGLTEVPASWPAATLEAQAIAGRSYALRRVRDLTAQGTLRTDCRCHLRDTPADQNYEGWDHESADARMRGAWVAAVGATASRVLLHQGQVAETFYSSSHGGHSESARFVFGGDLPYVQPVDDSRWDLASTNPLRRWTATATADQVGAAAGVGRATSVELLEPRGAAGRVGHPDRGYGGVRVTGTGGTVVLSGDQVRQRLGLRSTLFRLASAPPPDPGPTPPPPPPPPPGEPAPDLLQRVAADDRVQTAVAVSQQGWDSVGDVVIAASDRFPDALAGVRLAASLGAPLLLTPPDGLADPVAAEIDRLGATTAWLLGGEVALSSRVRADLAELGLETARLSGGTRFDTAAAVATAATNAADEVLIVLGDDWPDAVSAAALATVVDGPPILLAQRAAVPSQTISAMNQLGATRATIVGGTAVVSPAAEQQLRDLGIEVRRIAGADRFATSAAVAAEGLARRSGAVPLLVASGSGFPDALAAGALAARNGGLLVLAPGTSLDAAPAIRDLVAASRDRLDGGVVVGGTGAVPAQVEEQLERALAG